MLPPPPIEEPSIRRSRVPATRFSFAVAVTVASTRGSAAGSRRNQCQHLEHKPPVTTQNSPQFQLRATATTLQLQVRPKNRNEPAPPRLNPNTKQQTCSAMMAKLTISSCPPASLASARLPTMGLATGTTPTIRPEELGGTKRTSFTAESGRSRSRARRSPSRRSALWLMSD